MTFLQITQNAQVAKLKNPPREKKLTCVGGCKDINDRVEENSCKLYIL